MGNGIGWAKMRCGVSCADNWQQELGWGNADHILVSECESHFIHGVSKIRDSNLELKW